MNSRDDEIDLTMGNSAYPLRKPLVDRISTSSLMQQLPADDALASAPRGTRPRVEPRPDHLRSLPARRDVELQNAADAEIRSRHGAEVRNVQPIVGTERHAARHVEARDHILDRARVHHADHLALT